MKTPSAVQMLLWAGLVVVAAEPKDLQEKLADTPSTQQLCQPDINTVLREMSTLIGEQRVELKYTKTQLDSVEARLRASENKAETMETRLRASENLVEQLKSENEALARNLNLTMSQVEELGREREERRVAFSASLEESGGGNKGPFSEAIPLVYRKIYTNIGNAYNPNTGVFTAPVRGVYSFVLFVLGFGHASRIAAVSLHKNGEKVLLSSSHLTSGYGKTSNGVSLLLEVGDVVYVKLWPDAWIFDDHNHHTTFSGHLLFTM